MGLGHSSGTQSQPPHSTWFWKLGYPIICSWYLFPSLLSYRGPYHFHCHPICQRNSHDPHHQQQQILGEEEKCNLTLHLQDTCRTETLLQTVLHVSCRWRHGSGHLLGLSGGGGGLNFRVPSASRVETVGLTSKWDALRGGMGVIKGVVERGASPHWSHSSKNIFRLTNMNPWQTLNLGSQYSYRWWWQWLD